MEKKRDQKLRKRVNFSELSVEQKNELFRAEELEQRLEFTAAPTDPPRVKDWDGDGNSGC